MIIVIEWLAEMWSGLTRAIPSSRCDHDGLRRNASTHPTTAVQLALNLAVQRIERAVGFVALGTDFTDMRSPALKLTELAGLVSEQEVDAPEIAQVRVASSPFFRTVKV